METSYRPYISDFIFSQHIFAQPQRGELAARAGSLMAFVFQSSCLAGMVVALLIHRLAFPGETPRPH